jgi:AcrR family transcriptional regulator
MDMDVNTEETGPRPPGRPRKREVDEAIAAATIALLSEGGYDALSVEAVARRAGVGRPVIYRRFQNKTDLTIAVISRLAAVSTGRHEGIAPKQPRTGSLRGDIEELLVTLEASFDAMEDAQIMPGLLGDLIRNPELARRFFGDYLDVAQAAIRAVFAEAAERGEMPGGHIPEAMLSLFIGTYIYHRYVIGQKLSVEERRLVAEVIAAGLGSRRAW